MNLTATPKNIFIISGPSGVGEDSVISGLEKILPVERIVTTTTRAPRPGESEGKPYYFLSEADFRAGIRNKAFAEYAEEYNGQLYGVTTRELTRVAESGRIGLWKIEYKGVQTAKKLFPDMIAIFLNAPLPVLADRIRRRSHVTDEYVAERMAYTREWLKHTDIYDYQVENEEGKLDQTIRLVAEIIERHRQR